MIGSNSTDRPLIHLQSAHHYLDHSSLEMTSTNADGEPVIDITPEQRYTFDTQGWIVIPGVLSESEAAVMRDFCVRVHGDPESLPEHERCGIAGPLEKLTDHPLIVGFMNEFLAHPELTSEDCYGFRMESASICVRKQGEGAFAPHNGNGLLRLPGDGHNYRCIPGLARSSLTCVVWEFNEVEPGGGGTNFISGSHKAAFLPPESTQSPDSPLWSNYSCPPGSLVIFAEGTAHTATSWTSAERDRVALFSRYNYVNSKWHKWQPPQEMLESLPPKRQTLFRPVHVEANLISSA